LTFYGLKKIFYEETVLVFHQYHKPFKELKNKLLSHDLTFDQVRFHNDRKRKFNEKERTLRVVENGNWGEIINKEHYKCIITTPLSKIIKSKKADIDFFLFFELQHLSKGYWGFRFEQLMPKKIITFKSVLYQLWTIRNRDLKAKGEYTLKEVNDLLLKFLIYQGFDFHLVVNLENASLELRLKID